MFDGRTHLCLASNVSACMAMAVVRGMGAAAAVVACASRMPLSILTITSLAFCRSEAGQLRVSAPTAAKARSHSAGDVSDSFCADDERGRDPSYQWRWGSRGRGRPTRASSSDICESTFSCSVGSDGEAVLVDAPEDDDVAEPGVRGRFVGGGAELDVDDLEHFRSSSSRAVRRATAQGGTWA